MANALLHWLASLRLVFLAFWPGMKAVQGSVYWLVRTVSDIPLHSSFFMNVEVSQCCGSWSTGAGLSAWVA